MTVCGIVVVSEAVRGPRVYFKAPATFAPEFPPAPIPATAPSKFYRDMRTFILNDECYSTSEVGAEYPGVPASTLQLKKVSFGSEPYVEVSYIYEGKDNGQHRYTHAVPLRAFVKQLSALVDNPLSYDAFMARD